MSSVNDVLGGKTYLLQQSDAGVLATSLPYANANYFSQVFPFNSSNSSFQALPAVASGNSGNVGSYSPQSVVSSSASGRMFNNGNDVVVTLSPSYRCSDDLFGWEYHYFNPVTGSKQEYCLQKELEPNASTISTKVVMGNFQGNNLVEPLMFAQSNFGGYVLSQMNIITATINQVDVIDYTGGQPVYSRDDSNGAPYPLGSTIVTGDFNGDGLDEIAVLFSDFQTIQLFKVTLPTLTITPYQTITLPTAVPNGTLAAGRFDASNTVYLTAVGQGSQADQVTVDFVAPNASPVAIKATTYTVPGLNSSVFSGVFAQAAPIANWSSSTVQQLVLGLTYENDSWHSIEVGSFDTQRVFHLLGEQGLNGCLFGLQVGNFNHQSSTSTSFAGNIDPTLQIGLLQNDRSGSQCSPPYADKFVHLAVENIKVPAAVQQDPQSSNPPPPDPSMPWFSSASDSIPDLGPYSQLTSISFLSGDFQGHSLRLGAPEKITLTQHTQPDFVLGLPPMHVDWVSPGALGNTACEPNAAQGDKKQCVVNLTVKPYGQSSDQTTGFTSSYATSQTDTSQSSRKSTTSWGVAGKITEGATISYGQKGIGTVSASVTASASNAYTNVHQSYDALYTAATDSLTTTTGFDDDVYFTTETQNIFSYPVLGQKDADGNPLYVLYSVPSQVTTGWGNGASLEWYQPIHEPGNVLSYPSSLSMLTNEYPANSVSSQATSICSFPGSASSISKVSWEKSQKTSTSSGWNDAFSANVNVSITASVTPTVLTDGVGGKITGSVDVSGSSAWGRLNQSSTTLQSDHAVVIQVPQFGKTKSQLSSYAYQSFVFGGANANAPFQDPSSILPSGLDVTTTGPLYTSFIANPVSGNSGVNCGQPGSLWWPFVYTKPDVGFNHPNRWDVSQTNVVSFNAFTPVVQTPILDQVGYQMKGLFITTSSPSSESPGSIVSSVTAGEKITLTARVYNFSLVETNHFDSSTTVHVRFYAQPKSQVTRSDGTTVPDVTPGRATLIRSTGPDGDFVIPSIPAFGQDKPNWQLASVSFDTTGYDDTELIFWAVTWVEDGNRKVVSEMPDHGVLLESFAGKNFSDLTDIPIQAHSNNIGLYGSYSPFYVKPASSSEAHGSAFRLAQVETVAAGQPTAMAIHLAAAPAMQLDQRNKVLASFAAETESAGATVRYYDGDPFKGGLLFDYQSIHPLPAGSNTTQRLFFRPKTCGAHTLYAIADREDLPSVTATLPTFVSIDTSKQIDAISAALGRSSLPATTKSDLGNQLERARSSFASGQVSEASQSLQQFEELLLKLEADLGTDFLGFAEQMSGQSQAIRSCEVAMH